MEEWERDGGGKRWKGKEKRKRGGREGKEKGKESRKKEKGNTFHSPEAIMSEVRSVASFGNFKLNFSALTTFFYCQSPISFSHPPPLPHFPPSFSSSSPPLPRFTKPQNSWKLTWKQKSSSLAHQDPSFVHCPPSPPAPTETSLCPPPPLDF
jgi:hypothetical protein